LTRAILGVRERKGIVVSSRTGRAPFRVDQIMVMIRQGAGHGPKDEILAKACSAAGAAAATIAQPLKVVPAGWRRMTKIIERLKEIWRGSSPGSSNMRRPAGRQRA